MPRPTVLVVDSNETRRREVSRGLAEFAYEVVVAENAANGMRFATGLVPRLIVCSRDLEGFGDLSVVKFLTPNQDTGELSFVAILADDAAGYGALPENVAVLPVQGLTSPAIVRKLRTVMLGLELGLERDGRLESVVGDLQLQPLFELLPELQKLVVTGRLVMDEGEIAMHEGCVIAAAAGAVRGRKAFARLGRVARGTFRLLVGPPGHVPEIDDDLLSLMAVAMEDHHRFHDLLDKLPDWQSRLKVEMTPAFFSTHFSEADQQILQASQTGRTISAVVDSAAGLDGEVLEGILGLVEKGFVRFEEPEIRVRVVTDSTADLPPELVRLNRIHVVPLSVIFGEDIYRDGVDITPGAFYKLLQTRKDVHPRTNPPSRGEFLADYRLLAATSDLVSVHISERMSQTVVHARQAVLDGAPELEERREDGSTPVLEVVDSGQVSAGLGLLALLAARMANKGLSAGEVRRRIDEMAPRFHLLFVVDTLEYLARGGRIGKARALLGGLLGIKPILGIVNGEVAAVDRVRGGKAAHPRLVELFKQRVDADKPVMVGVAHAAAPLWAARLRSLLEQSFQILELLPGEIGPVVGTHAGPGAVGAVLFQPTEEELPLVAPLEDRETRDARGETSPHPPGQSDEVTK